MYYITNNQFNSLKNHVTSAIMTQISKQKGHPSYTLAQVLEDIESGDIHIEDVKPELTKLFTVVDKIK